MSDFFDVTLIELTDENLIKSVQDGNNEAYRVLFERYRGILKGIVARYASDFDSEDLMQEASLSFYYAAQFFDFQSASFKTYSKVCAERGVISAIRKSKAQRRIPESLIVPLSEEVENPSDNPERLVLEQEAERIVLEKLIEQLSRLEINVLKSFLSTGSYDLTARELSLSRKSVDNALSRIRRKLDLSSYQN